MDRKDIFNSVYEDFFGINKLSKENEKLAEEIAKLKSIGKNEIPTIDVKDVESKENIELSEEEKNNLMTHYFEKIDNLYIEDKSKELLKKIIEYMRKYYEKIEKDYIPFDMCICTNNNETIDSVMNILKDVGYKFKYIKNGNAKMFSMFDIEKVDELVKIYNGLNNIIAFKNFENFNSKELEFKNRFLYKLNECVSNSSNRTITIFTAYFFEIINQVFESNEDIKERFDDFIINGIEPDVQDVYQDLIERIDDRKEKIENFDVRLLDYISNTYPNNSLPYPKYREGLYQRIVFNNEIPDFQHEKSLDEIFAELNELVGLEKVKQVLKDLVNLIELKNKTEKELNIKNVNLHMIFLGNPGTGKTTVARIVAEILYNLKYVKQNKLIEVSSKDLVAEYVGQTAPKTMGVIQKALGGVLFIDEAYTLASGKGQGNSYNEEAIATLIQAMENYRNEFVVIFAGYTKEMQDFLNANSGIVSRIGYTVEFEDYTTEELIKIFEQMMTKSGFIVTEEAILRVKELIEEYKDSKNFGNARFVRNLYEKAIVKHATNTKGKKDKKKLKTITEKDINAENLLK